MRPAPIVPLALVLLAVAACGSDAGTSTEATPSTTTPSPTASPSTATESTAPLLTGIGGLIPPHFPTPSNEDWRTFFAALPDDYYAAALEHVAGRPVGFSEVGWPSAPIAPFVGTAAEGFGGSPEEQSAFVQRLAPLIAPVAPRFVMWSWAYDTSVLSDVFASIGLSSDEGVPKPALAAWVEFAEGRSE